MSGESCSCDNEGTLIGTSWHQSRKLRHCVHCDESIDVGELHERQAVIFDGHFYDNRLHMECALDGCCEGERPSPRPFRRIVKREWVSAAGTAWTYLALNEVRL